MAALGAKGKDSSSSIKEKGPGGFIFNEIKK